MQKKNLFASAILMLCTLFVFTGCKEVMSSLDNPVNSYFKLTETSTKIYRGQSYQIKFTAISDAKPIFKSSDEKIALVDENGVVTGANRGTATPIGRYEHDTPARYKSSRVSWSICPASQAPFFTFYLKIYRKVCHHVKRR